MTVLAPEPTTTAQDTGDNLTHSVCACDDDLALCGADVSGQPWADDDEEVDCVVCQDLMGEPCARCGQ